MKLQSILGCFLSVVPHQWWFVQQQQQKADVSLDHSDQRVENGWLNGINQAESSPQLIEALGLQCTSRIELVLRLGALLDECSNDEEDWSLVELRYADTLARVARDACLEAARSRCARASHVMRVLHIKSRAPTDLRPAFTALGNLQRKLGKTSGTSAQELIHSAAVALDCEEAALGCLRSGETHSHENVGLGTNIKRRALLPFSYLMHHQDATASDVHRDQHTLTTPQSGKRQLEHYSQLAQVIITNAVTLRRGRPQDADARFLRRAFRRRVLFRLIGIATLSRLALLVKRKVDDNGGPKKMSKQFIEQLTEIIQRRVIEPGTSLRDDLVLNKRGTSLADPRALAEAERTLEMMLDDWTRDTQRGINKEARAQAVADHDMSSVNNVLAAETRSAVRNLLSGNIVRALLIQVQYVSTEMHKAMTDIDAVVAANQATIQLLSLFPGFLLLVACFRLFRTVIIALVSESVQSDKNVYQLLAATFSDAARLIFIAPSNLPLADTERGALATLIFTIQRTLKRHRARFHPERLARLDRALRDLLNPLTPAGDLKFLVLHLLSDHTFLRVDGSHSSGVTPLPPLDVLPATHHSHDEIPYSMPSAAPSAASPF